jgi:hypothetical protein
MRIDSFDGDTATVQLKALEVRILRDALSEAAAGKGDLEERFGVERDQIEGLRDTLAAVFDQIDPGDL